MTQASRTLADQLIRVGLFLFLFSAGVIQLFFTSEVRQLLLRLQAYLQRVYGRHPILLRMFGPPLRTLNLKGYTVAKRIGGVLLILISVIFLVSVFQSPDPCEDDYWSITRRDPC